MTATPIRVSAAILLLAIAAGPLYLVFAAIRLSMAGFPTRIIVFPTDFVGTAVVVEDTANGSKLHTGGFWHREIIIHIPPSGILPVQNIEPIHWITREKVILADGTLIDGTDPWGRFPSRFRHTDVPKKLEPLLAKYKQGNRLDCVAYELAATPQFRNFTPKKDQQQ
jgi:hypothetical protein